MKSNFKEKDFQSMWTKWVKKNAFASFPYELKISKGRTVAFSKFEDQQLPALQKASENIFHFKLTDASLGLKPFDGFVFKRTDAYVGIMFETKKQQDICYFLHISYVMALKEAGAKSIKLKDCEECGLRINLRDI